VATTTTAPGQEAYGQRHFRGRRERGVSRPLGARAPRWLGWPATAVVSALATLFSWKTAPWPHVSAGVNSWEAGLALGFTDHLQWGRQAVFTFGPYGFVENILPFSHLTAALALLYALAITWGLAALIVAALRNQWGLGQQWGLLPAGVVAWAALGIAANLLEAPELALATALGLALASFRTNTVKARLYLLAALGALAGFQLLVEINVGFVTTALLVIAIAVAVVGAATATATGAPYGGRASAGGSERASAGASERASERAGGRVNAALAGLVPFVAVPIIALVSAGQSLGELPSYLRGSLSVALGYGPAMSLSTGRTAEDWYAVVDVVLLAAIFVLALRGRPGLEKAAISLMLLGWTWEALKEGFVRHDTHDLTFFALVLLALCLAGLPRKLLPLQAGAIALAALLACLANGHPPPSLRSPAEDTTALATEVRDLAVPGDWPGVERTAQAEMRTTGDYLPAAVLPALRGHTLAAETLEDGITFAYNGLRWDPEPVLQSYSAYTAYLDQLDAHFLSSPRAPARILYQPVTINNRDPWWEPPGTLEAMYCHYRQIGPVGHWLLLARVTGPSGSGRCGAPVVIGQATAHFGQAVEVPAAAGKMVVATFSVSSPLAARAEAVALKGPQVEVTVWAGAGAPKTYRFIAGTAGDAHVLATPAGLGYLPAFTPRAVRKLEMTGGGWAGGQGTVHVTFYSVSLRRA
jgi:hypothetical protein